MTEFLYIQNKDWIDFEEWKPFHLKIDEEYKLFCEDKFDLMHTGYIQRFSNLIYTKILTYD